MNKTCHTGGAEGSDIFFEKLCIKNNIEIKAYSFKEHNTNSKHRVILNVSELIEGWDKVQQAAKVLKRNTYNMSAYVKKLLSRNWFQVKNSDTIIGVGYILNPKEQGKRTQNKTSKQIVDGGTGYAVELAIQHKKPVYIFNQKDNKWYKWDFKFEKFIETTPPKLTKNFAGVGTRELNDYGRQAILDIFKNSFSE